MSPIERFLSGDLLILSLDEERQKAEDPRILDRDGRNARTLFKQGPLRATLVALAPGGELAEHRAPGPITIQPLRGRLRLSLEAEEHALAPGDLSSVGPEVPHTVSSEEGAVFLLTLAHPEGSDDR